MNEKQFKTAVWDYYNQHGRDLPWRRTDDPYKIMVSEIMLQQTQVQRVIPKYKEFLKTFPTVSDLAKAPLAEVLKIWSGLGYNRRAKFLHQTSVKVVNDFDGTIPKSLDDLVSLPGIERNTAGAINAYAYNQPAIFIETNVRTVYLHHFFKDQTGISDGEITPLIKKTIDQKNPREFYWALMDYGTFLKATVGNSAKNSKHYTKQSKFEGSLRQIRGAVLRALGEGQKTLPQLLEKIEDVRVERVLVDLEKEKMITRHGQLYHLG